MNRNREITLRKIILHPGKCTGCLQCLMACSLKYEGRVNPLKARTKLTRDGIDTRIVFTSECTRCGACVTACQYGAREIEVE